MLELLKNKNYKTKDRLQEFQRRRNSNGLHSITQLFRIYGRKLEFDWHQWAGREVVRLTWTMSRGKRCLRVRKGLTTRKPKKRKKKKKKDEDGKRNMLKSLSWNNNPLSVLHMLLLNGISILILLCLYLLAHTRQCDTQWRMNSVIYL